MNIVVDSRLTRKAIAHSLKYPNQDVFGLVLAVKGKNDLVDVVPLCHNPINSCFLQMCLDMLSKSNLLRDKDIVGVYTDKNIQEPENDEFIKKLVNVLKKISGRQLGFFVKLSFDKTNQETTNYDQLSYKEALVQFDKEKYGLKIEIFQLKEIFKNITTGCDVSLSLKDVKSDYDNNLHLKLVDLDGFFDNPSRDFSNAFFN